MSSSWPTCSPASPAPSTPSWTRGRGRRPDPRLPTVLRGHRTERPPRHSSTAPRRRSGHVLDLDAIDTAMCRGRRGAAVQPTEPHGTRVHDRRATALAAIVNRHGGRVIADEVHAPLVYPDRRFVPYATVSAAAAHHAVTVTSASKAWNMPGLECAQVIAANHADAAAWRALPLFSVSGATWLGIVASTAAYFHGGPWRRELVAYLDGNRRLLGELLATQVPGVHYRQPEGTFLAWLDCAELAWRTRRDSSWTRPRWL